MKKEKTFGKEVLIGTLATVLGGVILAIISSENNPLLGKLSDYFNKTVISLWEFLKSPSEIPAGIIFLTDILLISGFVFQFRKMQLLSKQLDSITRPRSPMLHDYGEDTICGIVWRWDRIPPSTLDALRGFCPMCGTRLIRNAFYAHANHESIFYCTTCKKDIAKLDGDLNSALNSIWIQIERKINTGEWKKVVELQKKSAK